MMTGRCEKSVKVVGKCGELPPGSQVGVVAALAVRQKTGAADPAKPCYDNGAFSVGSFNASASVASMIGTYAYTPDIWPPLATIALVAVLGIYSWRLRRTAPGARFFAVTCLFWLLLLLGAVGEIAAVDPAARIAWHTFQALWQLPIATAVTCFTLDYVQPGRWLTRRNLVLLWIPPLLVALLILTNPAHYFFWRSVIFTDEARAAPAPGGWISVIYAMLLALVQAGALLWLFVHSRQHRWPVVLMLTSVVITRGIFIASVAGLDSVTPLDSSFSLVLLSAVSYAIALFGFHFFDPAPMARQAVLEQMTTGVVVCDGAWRVVSLNPAAEQMLGRQSATVRRKQWQELAPGGGAPGAANPGYELTLGSTDAPRRYAPTFSPLHDFRGLLIGHLIMLSDVTEQRRTEAQILEQQRALAALHEREQLARELHDSIGQVLGAASLQVEAARQLIDAGQLVRAETQLARLASVLQAAHADVREQILNLRAAPSPQQPLFTTVHRYLDSFTDNYEIVTKFAVGDELCDATLAPATELQLFRILQEALSNARKHGGARSVEVTFTARDGALRMSIVDDGCGFDPGAAAQGGSHFGLHFMGERATELGGSLHVDSAPGAGARVAVEIPWQER